MQKTLRQNSILFSSLGMGMLYCSLIFDMIGIALRRGGDPGGDILAALAHFVLALLVSCGLCRVFRPEGPAIFSQGTGRFLLSLLILAGLACIAIALSPDKMLLSLRYPLLHPAIGLFMPLGFTLFLQLSPAGREGLLFGLVIAFGEFLWFVLFPLMYSPLTLPTSEEELLQFAATRWTVLGITLCCLGGACFAAVRRRHSETAAPDEQSGIILAAVAWLFGASLGISVLFGLATGKFLPKLGYMPMTANPLYFLLLALFPLAGMALDRGKGLTKIALPFMAACLFIPLLDAAVRFAFLDPGALFVYTAAIKILLFMSVWIATARLLKTHRLFPLLVTLVYALHLAQIPGAALRVFAPAYAHSVVAFLIAGAVVFCLWRFRALLLKNPGLWDLPAKPSAAEAPPETPPEASPEAAREKLAAFSLVFDLTKREGEILSSLLSGLNPGEIARKYQIAENTVRRHLTSLIRKAQTRSSRRLIALYTTWTPPTD
ncbi:hypothetical protein FACS1894206_02980 [Deltaproteobacteria bacterium]|nr:hypothetical protein FACS1894206_02980 [Deltaproteobacteria bacterium]